MTNEQIEKFVIKKHLDKGPVQINFKTRPSIKGIFIKTNDFNDLKAKNLWRIVGGLNIEAYQKTKDVSLARIFNGVEITRLESVDN